MKGYNKGKIFTLITIISIITLCLLIFTNKISKDEKSIMDSAKDLEVLEEVISKELRNIYTWVDGDGVVVESHITLDVVEKEDNTYKAYLLTRGGTFKLNKNNEITEISGEGKSAKTITFKKEKDNFKYMSHEEVKDGAYYTDSVNDMLPRKFRKYVFEETEYDKELEEKLMKNAPNAFDNINEKIYIKANVSDIFDGDSIFVNYDINENSYNNEVYLAGIDAPEFENPMFNEMPYAKEAKKRLEELLKDGDEIYIQINEKMKNDLTSRIAGYVYVEYDDKFICVNDVLAYEGFAIVTDTIYEEVDNKIIKENYEELLLHQKDAKDNKLNIWEDDDSDLVTNDKYNKKYIK